MQLNTIGPIRGRVVTLDYTDEEPSALLLARPRREDPPPVACETIGLIERVLQRERQKRRPQVPRMSMLMRFEAEHERRLAHVKRQFALLLGVLTLAFWVGLTAGLFVRPPSALRPSVTSVQIAVRGAASQALNQMSALAGLYYFAR